VPKGRKVKSDSKRNKLKLSYLITATIFTLLIIYLSSLPSGTLPGDGSTAEQVLSNLAHIPAFALITFLWIKAFADKKLEAKTSLPYILIIVGLCAFAVSDEIHQSYVPGRFASITDFLLDLIGILLGMAAVRFSHNMFAAKAGS
jgi:VanZ family protein